MRRLGLPVAIVALLGAALPAQANSPVSHGVTVPASWFGGTPPLADGQIEVAVVSSLPATVTGESARIDVRGVQAGDMVRVDRDGTDVSGDFAPAGAGTLDGVVDGLRVGVNHVTATVTGPTGTRTATLELTDHPISGPVISGPHQAPFLCQTEAAGMGKPLDADCSAKTRVEWFARSAVTGRFNPLTDPYAAYPPDTATTTTSSGATVPFVVRVESSTINRSITRVAVLDDPHGRGAGKPYAPSAAWNRRMIYSFGESCGTGHSQGVDTADNALGQISGAGNPYDNAFAPFIDLPTQIGTGYMTAFSTLTILGVECNDVISAETLMMVKEHVIKTYGKLVHVIGSGASGGAIQQYTAANNYPGLIDAGNAIISFPDVTTLMMTIGDCLVLDRVFNADPMRWTEVKREAVTGFRTSQLCADWDSSYSSLLRPSDCDPTLPANLVYDPKTRRNGVRCTFQDDQVTLWGRDPATGFARRPLDNTGVTYGLAALRAGTISAADFVALNAAAGGVDIDGNFVPQRMSMDPEVARIAYDTGRLTGRGAVSETPIIDNHPYLDVVPVVDVHDTARPYSMRARMDAHQGGHATQAMWQGAPYPSDGFAPDEAWLTALEKRGSGATDASRTAAVIASRPASASDRCTLPFGAGLPDLGPCPALAASSPRQAAGAPTADDVIKCTLKPIAAADFPGMSTTDLDALRRAFPTGVCNWAAPGVGDVPHSRVWLSWGDGSRPPTPVALHNVVARSAVPAPANGSANVLGSTTTRAAGLPPTGGRSALPVGLAAVAVAVVLRRRLRRA
ncbi:MAG TPA: DUF6351 family protein [Acidimicrobiales bacterium]|nr:DUF6351 family protein [Acidimicrobiales bacterium]